MTGIWMLTMIQKPTIIFFKQYDNKNTTYICIVNFKLPDKWLTLFLTTAPLAEPALMSVLLKLSLKAISIKSTLISVPIVVPVLMYVRLKQFILHNFTRYKQNLKSLFDEQAFFLIYFKKYFPVIHHQPSEE